MRQFYQLLAANFKMTIRNRQALFWLFLFPVMLMGLFGIAFNDGQAEPKLGLVDLDKSEISRGVGKGFSKAKIVEVRKLSTVKEARRKLKEGDLNGVVVLHEGLAEDVERLTTQAQAPRAGGVTGRAQLKPAKIDFYFDPSDTFVSEVTRGIVAGVLEKIDRTTSGAPVLMELRNNSVRQKNLRYIDFLVPGIIAMTLMNSALFGLGGTIVNYRERGILRRLKVTPQPLTMFLGAQITNQLLFSILRAILLVLVARLLFDVTVIGNYLTLFVVVIIGSLTFVTVAFTVASFTKNREVYDSISNLVTMPMMFLSGVFFPMDGAPSWIKPFINALPLKYLADAMRSVMIKGDTLSAISFELVLLLAFTFVFFIMSVATWRWE